MRLDKFLKISRLIKRRTIACEACQGGRVLLNDRVAKASTKVKVGDKVTINYGNQTLNLKVLQLLEHVTKDNASTMYEIIES